MANSKNDSVRVTELLGDELSSLGLRVLSGASHLDNLIFHPRVQKPGLAFAGYYAYIKPGRVQIVGESETEYLKTLSEAERQERFERIASLPVPVFVITKGISPLPGFLLACQEREVPVLTSSALSSTVIKAISYFLEDHLVPSTSLHGVLLDIYGLGVLLIGVLTNRYVLAALMIPLQVLLALAWLAALDAATVLWAAIVVTGAAIAGDLLLATGPLGVRRLAGVIGVAFLVAMVQQLVRRGDRFRLTSSLAAISGAVVLVAGLATLIALRRSDTGRDAALAALLGGLLWAVLRRERAGNRRALS